MTTQADSNESGLGERGIYESLNNSQIKQQSGVNSINNSHRFSSDQAEFKFPNFKDVSQISINMDNK